MKKRLFAALMCAVLLVSSAMTVLADASTDPASTTGGGGNILYYSVEKVVVPTALSIAFNPGGYVVNKKYVAAVKAQFSTDKTYYTYDSGTKKYSVADPQPENANALDSTDYFTAVQSATTDEVISLNYGIANKSTESKYVTIDLKATYTPISGKDPIVFVDTAAKTLAYNADTNPNGAKTGEYKVYLAVKSAKEAAPTVDDNYFATEDKTKGSKTYYTLADGKYTAFEGDSFASGTTYYEKTNDIDKHITGALLSDVTMTASETPASYKTFATEEGSANKAETKISYKLGNASYGLKAGEFIDFNTTQEQLVGDKLEMKTIGGAAGFTIFGEINNDANWQDADSKAITITPVYTVENVTAGRDTAVTGAYNQVTLAAETHTVTIKNKGDYTGDDTTKTMTTGEAPVEPDEVSGYDFEGYYTDATCETEFTGNVLKTTTTLFAKWATANVAPSVGDTNILTSGQNAVLTVDLGRGNLAATKVSAMKWKSDGKNYLGSTFTYNASEKTITIPASSTNYCLSNPAQAVYIIVFADDSDTTVKEIEVTLTAAD